MPGARIVSLVPSLTELLCELGLGPQLVGRTGFCIHPRSLLESVPKVGGTKTVNIARIRALAPTHLVVNVDENERATVEALAEFIPYVVVTHPIELDDNLALYSQFGEIFSVEHRARQLSDAFEQARLRARTSAGSPVSVLYLIWRRPWMTVSQPTFISRMLAEVGLLTWPEGSQQRYPSLEAPDLARAPVAAVLLSTEPFRFDKVDREALRRLFKRHNDPAHQAPAFLSVDGEMTSWYGSRAIMGLDYLTRLRARMDVRLHQAVAARRVS